MLRIATNNNIHTNTIMIEMKNTITWAFLLAVFTIFYTNFLLGIYPGFDLLVGLFIVYMGFQVVYSAIKYIFYYYSTIYEKEE